VLCIYLLASKGILPPSLAAKLVVLAPPATATFFRRVPCGYPVSFMLEDGVWPALNNPFDGLFRFMAALALLAATYAWICCFCI